MTQPPTISTGPPSSPGGHAPPATTMLEVREWRRPTTGLWIGSAVAFGVMTLLAAWLGGILPAPGWFAPAASVFWSVVA